MGLIQMAASALGGVIGSGVNAVGGVLADQWIDFILCDSLSDNVLMAQGKKPQQARSGNTKGSENIISNGSKINVNEGQCMLIIENGQIVDYCAQPGQYTYNNQIQPSLFGGGLKDLGPSFAQIGKRFMAGGAATDQQKVYFVNTKEILNNKVGWGKIPFRHYDPEFDKSIVVQVQGFGMYTFTVADPLMFYKNIAGNITADYTKDMLLTVMKAEIMSALNPALGKIATQKIPYDELILYPEQLGTYVNEQLGPRWGNSRGIEIRAFAVESITVDEESAKKISQLQETAIHTDAGMAGARLITAQANAMENAAKNEGGATNAFIGMGMAQNAGGVNAADLFAMSNQQKQNRAQAAQQAQAAPAAAPQAPAGGWTCACGAVNTGKFCAECGAKQPEKAAGWTCSCGAVNEGKFCSECGKSKPADAPQYKCDKCGWEPEDKTKLPKFCPECGNQFVS
ncbi:MAG: SPFH domain-containing protein [Oscillospiraceae bacterium]|jgi:membrane protease subunit (stomatin/prohibitin family)|nr:SPFH domain-containing protein [Oscillospiraceae bacterium]